MVIVKSKAPHAIRHMLAGNGAAGCSGRNRDPRVAAPVLMRAFPACSDGLRGGADHPGRQSHSLKGVLSKKSIPIPAVLPSWIVQTMMAARPNLRLRMGRRAPSTPGGSGCQECECVEDATFFYDDFESYFSENINGTSIVHSDVAWVSSPTGVDDVEQGGGWIQVTTSLLTPQHSFVLGPTTIPLKMATRLYASAAMPNGTFIGFQSAGGDKLGFQVGTGLGGTLLAVATGPSSPQETNIPIPQTCEEAILLELVANLTNAQFFINGNLVATLDTSALTNTLFNFGWSIPLNGGESLFVDMACIRNPRRCISQI